MSEAPSSSQVPNRKPGTFQPGRSGNPGGRPKLVDGINLKELARSHAPAAIQTLIDIAVHGESEPARVSAANSILDRGFGKPLQQVGDGDGNALDWLSILAERKARV